MNFENAHKKLLEGKKIRRKDWEPFMHLSLSGGEVKTFRSETSNFYSHTSMLISNGWRVVDGDGKDLSFIDALEELRNKKHIDREEWQCNKFIFVDHDAIVACYAVEYEFMPSYKDMISTDWELLK